MQRLIGLALLVGAAVAAVPYLDAITDPPDVAAGSEPRTHGPRTVALRAGRDGHFLVEVSVNGRTVEMLADTGASAVVLTESDARRAGFSPRSLVYDVPVSTANGTTYTAAVTLDSIAVGGIAVDDVSALVAQPGDLTTSLLGMTFLGRLASVSMSGDTLELIQ